MCGLTLSIHPYPPSEEFQKILESLCAACAARGPDVQSTFRTVITTDEGSQIEVVLCASVLGLRGGVVQQPIVGQRGVLGWNGQVGLRRSRKLDRPRMGRKLMSQVFDGLDVGGGNDTAALAARLEVESDPLELLGNVEGP